MNCTGIPTHTVLISSQREVVLQQQALVSSNSQIPDMISTAVRKNSLVSGEVRDFIQELHDIGGDLIDQLRGLHINKQQQEQPIEGLAAGQGEAVRLSYHKDRYI